MAGAGNGIDSRILLEVFMQICMMHICIIFVRFYGLNFKNICICQRIRQYCFRPVFCK